MTALLVAAPAAVAAASLVGALVTARDPSLASRLARIADSGRVGAHHARRDAALAVRPTLARIGSRGVLGRVASGKVSRRRLEASGVDWSTAEVAGAKAAGALALGGGALVTLGLLAAIPCAVLAWRAPDLVLARRGRRRLARIDAELPQLLDLLAAASHAGLAGPLALRRAVEATDGPLSKELGGVLDEVDLGARWRDELRALADRVDLPDLRRAVAALTRTETLGSSLAGAMSDLAARVRDARRAATAERARKAPVKMLFPLVFLVLPAFLLLTVVPVLFSTVRSIR